MPRSRIPLPLPQRVHAKWKRTAGARNVSNAHFFCGAAIYWLLLNRSNKEDEGGELRSVPPSALRRMALGKGIGKAKRVTEGLTPVQLDTVIVRREGWIGENPGATHFEGMLESLVTDASRQVSAATDHDWNAEVDLGDQSQPTPTIPKAYATIDAMMRAEADVREVEATELYRQALAWRLLLDYAVPDDDEPELWKVRPSKLVVAFAMNELGVSSAVVNRVTAIRGCLGGARPFNCMPFMLEADNIDPTSPASSTAAS